MARIIGGLGTTHVPSIGKAIAEGKQNDPYWRPFFGGFDYFPVFIVTAVRASAMRHAHFMTIRTLG